jgi:hypothetical protein
MAITRKMLKAMGVEEDAIEQIIEAHTETVEEIKAERDRLKSEAAKVPDLQRQLQEAKAGDGEDWKGKYEKAQADFDAYKSKTEKERADAEKSRLYRKLLADAGVDPKRLDAVMRVADLDGVEVADGAIKDADALAEKAKAEWSDFIVRSGSAGADVDSPPAGGGKATMTRKEIMAIKDTTERQKAIAENMEAFQQRSKE